MAQPTVVSLSPGRQALSPRSANVSVTFARPPEVRTARALRVYSAQAGGRKAGQATLNGRLLTFDPAADFKAGETLWATLDTAARDSARVPLVRPQVWQFTAAATGGVGAFSGGSVVSVPSGPTAVAAGDIDGDGDVDLLTTNGGSGAGTLAIRLNDGTGNYAGAADVALNIAPTALSLADVDADGDLDVLMLGAGVQSGSGFRQMYLNAGQGSFRLASSISIGSVPFYNLCLGDLDGDGDLDLLYGVNYNNGAVIIERNNGAGQFSISAQLAQPWTMGLPVTMGDVDNDGDLDLLVVNASNNTVAVRLNNGRATFSNGSTVSVGAGPSVLRLADLDNDGDLDLLTLNFDQATPAYSVSVRLNDGAGTFGGGSTVAVGQRPQDLATADIDGDQDLDLLVVNRGSGTLSVRLNDGQGRFVGGSDPAFGTEPTLLATADIDNDGDVDVLVPDWATGNVMVRRNGGNAVPAFRLSSVTPAANAVAARTSAAQASFSTSLSTSASTVAALRVYSMQQGGRKAGIGAVSGSALTFTPTSPFKPGETVNATVGAAVQDAAGHPLVNSYVWQFTAAATGGSGRFPTGSQLSLVDSPQRVRLGDLDGDGDLDMVTTINRSSNPGRPQPVSVRLNNGSGVFGPSSPLFGSTVSGSDFALADVDNDGDLDYVGNTYDDYTLLATVRLNDGRGVFTIGGGVAAPASGAVALGDLDGDGDLDYVDGAVRLNDGRGNFYGSAAVGTNVRGSTLVDVDGDGDLDYLYSVVGDILCFYNDGTGAFTRFIRFNMNAWTEEILARDFDGDGDVDLLEPSLGTLRIWFNDGSGNFTPGAGFSYSDTQALAAGDVDGDGDLDLLTTYSGAFTGTTPAIYFNNGRGQFTSGPALNTPSFTGAALGDLDADGDLDIVLISRTASNNTGTWTVRLNEDRVTAAHVPQSAATWQLWPNPARSGETLRIQRPAATAAELTWRTPLGQVVCRQPLPRGSSSVVVPALPAGVYLLSLQGPVQNLSPQRVVLY